MKYPLEWHQTNLGNMKHHLNNLIENLRRQQRCVERETDECNKLEFQINLAKKRGLTEFDKDRLGIKRSKKEA